MEVAAALFCIGAIVVGGLYWFVCVLGPAEQKGKRATSITGGSISSENFQDKFRQYWSFILRSTSETDTKEEDTIPDFVDTFYNLVTDIYEWGWGQSFHFSPSFPSISYAQATRLHEQHAADLISAAPGQRIVDVGCGVGGPMRTIASHSRAHVVGITINDYQASRARSHNRKAGLDSLCDVVCDNFLKMPFEDESFDSAYAIEATCHATRLEDVYGEVFRVLKPGGKFVSFEWVTTNKYQADNQEHVSIIKGIVWGNAVPWIKSYVEIGAAARAVGFEVIDEADLASPPAGPWWTRLKMGKIAYWRNHVVVTVLAALGIAPKGTVEVHDMLFKTADFLTRSGETGIFSPMHMILLRKPENGASSAAATY